MSTLMQEFFDQRAEQWDSRVHNDHDRIAAILRLTGLKKGQKVLDIGCGTGVLVPHILPYEPADYQAIDVSEKNDCTGPAQSRRQTGAFSLRGYYGVCGNRL